MNPIENILSMLIFAGILFVSFSFFLVLMGRKIQVLRLAVRDDRSGNIGARLSGVFKFFLGQGRILAPKYIGAGIMHAIIFWGFMAVVINSIHFVGKGFYPDWSLPLFGPGDLLSILYLPFIDFFEVAVLMMVLWAGVRRTLIKPHRITLSWDAALILSLIGILMFTDLLLRATEGTVLSTSPLGNKLAIIFEGMNADSVGAVFRVSWWIHLMSLTFFLAFLPVSKHFHVITSLFNVYYRTLNYGALPMLDIENAENYGVSQIEQFSWKDLLDVYTCTECGRCQDACPAFATEKPLSPKLVNENMRDHLNDKSTTLINHPKEEWSGPSLVGGVIAEETIWACTMCKACEESCPLFIDFIDRFVGMRRHLVLEKSSFPPELNNTFKNLETHGNPWGLSSSKREEWANGLDVPRMSDSPGEIEVLYWVGCAGALDDANKPVSTSMIKIMKEAGVKFAILGKEETCTGDAARRLGNEYLFQVLASQNIETFEKYGIKKIVTQCPHCFNTIKNEYPQLEGNYEVVHHTDFIAELIRDGRIKPEKENKLNLTYHDSCFIGRHNGIYDSPREALSSVPGVSMTEMPRSRENGFCCGAGGGRMWLEETTPKVNQNRVDEAASINVDTVATACPFCKTMIKDGINETGRTDQMKTVDIAQVVADSI
ncbi:MAG: (Fe-S)-binding protein [Candidatus Marinimicrobia bacterium]|nr:(Fe-S)-binding protein [Candidatus Neomarinimicrobiota bacterium]